MMKATIYIWTLGLSLLAVNAHHDQTTLGTANLFSSTTNLVLFPNDEALANLE